MNKLVLLILGISFWFSAFGEVFKGTTISFEMPAGIDEIERTEPVENSSPESYAVIWNGSEGASKLNLIFPARSLRFGKSFEEWAPVWIASRKLSLKGKKKDGYEYSDIEVISGEHIEGLGFHFEFYDGINDGDYWYDGVFEINGKECMLVYTGIKGHLPQVMQLFAKHTSK
jgi:hypothetical protein